MKSASTWRRGAVAAVIALPLALASAGAAFAETSPSDGSSGYPATEVYKASIAVKQPVCDGNVPYLRYVVATKDPSATTVDLTWKSLDGKHSETQKNLPLAGKVIWLGAAEAGGQPTAWPGWVFKNGTWEEGGPYTWVRPEVNVIFTVHEKSTATPTAVATDAAATQSASFSDGVYRVGSSSAADARVMLPTDVTVGTMVGYPPATTACADPLKTPSTPTTPGSTSTTPGSTSSTPPAVPETTPPIPPKKTLAQTGADIAPFGGAAVVLLGIGGVLVLVSRRHRKLPNQD